MYNICVVKKDLNSFPQINTRIFTDFLDKNQLPDFIYRSNSDLHYKNTNFNIKNRLLLNIGINDTKRVTQRFTFFDNGLIGSTPLGADIRMIGLLITNYKYYGKDGKFNDIIFKLSTGTNSDSFIRGVFPTIEKSIMSVEDQEVDDSIPYKVYKKIFDKDNPYKGIFEKSSKTDVTKDIIFSYHSYTELLKNKKNLNYIAKKDNSFLQKRDDGNINTEYFWDILLGYYGYVDKNNNLNFLAFETIKNPDQKVIVGGPLNNSSLYQF